MDILVFANILYSSTVDRIEVIIALESAIVLQGQERRC